MQEVTLQFNTDDEGLNLTGTVNFPDTKRVDVSTLSIRGLAEWRHAPSNIIHVSEPSIAALKLVEKSKFLSKIGMNWIGIKAQSNILLSHAVRHGKNGTKKVQEQLTKFFKAIGASSVKFSILDVAREEAHQRQDEASSGD